MSPRLKAPEVMPAAHGLVVLVYRRVRPARRPEPLAKVLPLAEFEQLRYWREETA